MQLVTQTWDDATLIRVLEERIDAAVAVQFKDAMRDATANAGPRVILDMGRVEFLDSSGLGAVIGAMKQMGPDRTLELAALAPAVSKVFRLTRMDTIFTIHDTAPMVAPTASDAAHAY